MNDEATTAMASATQTVTVQKVPQVLSWRADSSQHGSRQLQTVNFKNANAVFAVDVSGSVAGGILITEKNIIQSVTNSEHHRANSKIVAWDTFARPPIALSQIHSLLPNGGTDPVCILNKDITAEPIEQSNAWWLITDGSIEPSAVSAFSDMIISRNITRIPAVVVVVGYAPTSNVRPADAEISVGASLFFLADHCLFLYADSSQWNAHNRKFYLLQAKGCFEHLGVVETLDRTVEWSNLPTVSPSVLATLVLPKTTHDPLGASTCLSPTLYIRITTLLLPSTLVSHSDIQELIGDEQIRNNLILACKIRGQTAELRSFLLRHKIEEVIAHEDVAGTQGLLRQLARARRAAAPIHELLDLQHQLREAHTRNEQHNRKIFFKVRETTRQHNSLIALALHELGEVERAGYSASQLGRLSNRAMRASKVSSDDLDDLEQLELDPSGKDSFRAECPICCEENQIMALTCKVLPAHKTEANTSDWALNFPLACGSAPHNTNVISAQIACVRCADYSVSMDGRSILREQATCVVPLVRFSNHFKLWHIRLAVALANHIEVGNLIQLFMAILDETMRTKQWAQRRVDDGEIMFRREAFEWTLRMLWHDSRSRSNFQENGEMVHYPEAVAYVIEEASRVQGSVDVWLMRYPIEGFLRLLRFAKKYDVPGRPLDDGLRLLHTRLMALLVELYHRPAEQEEKSDKKVDDNAKQSPVKIKPIARKIWAVLYTIRRDKIPIQGTARLANAIDTLLEGNDLSQVAEYFTYIGREGPPIFPFPAATTVILRRLLEIKQHDSVTHCIINLRSRDPMVIQALDYPAEVTEQDALQVLNEMFVPRAPNPADPHNAVLNPPPFVTPYGPSLVRCSYCDAPFASPGTNGTLADLALVLRQGRRDHFVRFYGATGHTGLPQRVPQSNGRLLSPSDHYNLHHSIIVVYAELTETGRAYILKAGMTPEAERDNKQHKRLERFMEMVIMHIAGVDGRGNVYHDQMADHIRLVMPSFWEVVVRDGFDPKQVQMRFVDKLKLELRGLGWLGEKKEITAVIKR